MIERIKQLPNSPVALWMMLIAALLGVVGWNVRDVFFTEEESDRSSDVADAPGWFDASGQRDAIPYRDEFTPWADQPSFNRLTGTPSYGDERMFLDARHIANTQSGSYKNLLEVRPGDHLMLRAYVHNNADPAVNQAADRRGSTVGARVRIPAPVRGSTEYQILAYIIADNAEPRWVADRVILRSSQPIRVTAVRGSGRLWGNTAFAQGGVRLPDSLFESRNVPSPDGPAALIGTNALDGVIVADGFASDMQVQLEVAVEAEAG